MKYFKKLRENIVGGIPDSAMIFKRIIIIILLLFSMVFLGTTGYMILENWKFTDALYMTVITLSTVGYKEIYELSEPGKWFTITLIAGGISVLAVVLGMFTSLILEGDLRNYLRRRKMFKNIKKLKDHIIICGLSDLGKEIMRNLSEKGHKFIVIENSEEKIQNALNSGIDFLYIKGDARESLVLEEAAIQKAATLITCLGEDSFNLFVVITARELNPSLNILAEAIDEKVKNKLKRAGSDYVISPTRIGASRMASVATNSTVVSFLDIMTSGGDREMQLNAIKIEKESNVISKTLGEIQIPKNTGLIVISVKKHEAGNYIYNPSSKTVLNPGDEILVLGGVGNIKKLKEFIK
ncbi:MAG: potassium channel protein [Elusimicrobia bacterium]|nr:potassium channel protein [Elusimicrobiota bacterium]